MSQVLKSGRIALTEDGLKNLNEMIVALKEKGCHLKLNSSKLVSEILEVFREKYFKKEQERLRDSMFDKRAYLKSLLNSESSIEEIIGKVIELDGKSVQRKKKAVGSKEALPERLGEEIKNA